MFGAREGRVRVPFLVVDLGPDVDPFILHLSRRLRRKNARLISKHTTEALAAAKARGVTPGNPKIGEGAPEGGS
jgi:hypothetical protein